MAFRAQLDVHFSLVPHQALQHLSSYHPKMRLINVHTLQLHDFDDSKIPPYCVASHRWAEEEITYEQFSCPQARSSSTFSKIKHFCDLIASLNKQDASFPRYLWIDTCCIDKRSSAELAKCINSMFRYYRNAHLCLAYLSDVRPRKEGLDDFERSAWFERGWTLQELLAPKAVLFLNAAWEPIGLKSSQDSPMQVYKNPMFDLMPMSMIDRLHKVTGIPRSVLRDFSYSSDLSVEEKWSWLAGRETKLPEDMAYCMLGIFGVFMPLIYGEGAENARMRLDEEIQRQSRRHLRRTMEGAWEGATSSRMKKPTSRPRDDSWRPMAMLGQDPDMSIDFGSGGSGRPGFALGEIGPEGDIYGSDDPLAIDEGMHPHPRGGDYYEDNPM